MLSAFSYGGVSLRQHGFVAQPISMANACWRVLRSLRPRNAHSQISPDGVNAVSLVILDPYVTILPNSNGDCAVVSGRKDLCSVACVLVRCICLRLLAD